MKNLNIGSKHETKPTLGQIIYQIIYAKQTNYICKVIAGAGYCNGIHEL